VEVIGQNDLLIALKGQFKDARGIRDWPDELTPLLDPKGVLVVSIMFLHNDGPDYRIVGLAKVKGSDVPAEVVFTLPGAWSGLVTTVEV
jgi:hypothetical protein